MGNQRQQTQRGRRLQLPAALVLVAALTVVGAHVRSHTSSPSITTSTTAVDEQRDGDPVTVEVQGIDGRGAVLLTQCVVADEVPDDRSCGRSAVANPTPEGTASLTVTVRSQVGTHPHATCPAPEGGRCVLRITQTKEPSRISSVRQTVEPEDNGPPPGRRLVQDIGLTVLEPGTETPGTETPVTDTPGTTPPEVGGVVVPAPLLPTAPVDGRGPATTPGEASVGGVTTDGPDRTSMPVTGNGQTVAIAVVGLLLVELGWLAMSATRRARLGLAFPPRHLAT